MARNRQHLRDLADARAAEAGALIAAALWDGAYYIAGYAVELALKACILARIEREGIIFDEGREKFGEQCWTHDLNKLIELAAAKPMLTAFLHGNPTRAGYWGTVKDWKPGSRYDRNSEAEARNLYAAITDPNDGVLPWMRSVW